VYVASPLRHIYIYGKAIPVTDRRGP
jgi:hypothetical protein